MAAVGEAPFRVRDEISGEIYAFDRSAEGGEEEGREENPFQSPSAPQVKVTSLPKECEGRKRKKGIVSLFSFPFGAGRKNVLRHLDKARKIETLPSKGGKEEKERSPRVLPGGGAIGKRREREGGKILRP